MEYIDAGFFFQNIPIKFNKIEHIGGNLYCGTVIAELIPQKTKSQSY